MPSAARSPLPVRERYDFNFPSALVAPFERCTGAVPDSRRNLPTQTLASFCETHFGGVTDAAMTQVCCTLVDLLGVPYSSLSALEPVRAVAILYALWEKKAEKVAAAMVENRVAVPPPELKAAPSKDAPVASTAASSATATGSSTAGVGGSDVSAPESQTGGSSSGGGGDVSQQLAVMVGLVQRLSASFDEVRKELDVVKGQVAGAAQAAALPERLDGLKEGLLLTDGAVTAMVLVVEDESALLGFPGSSDPVSLPHRALARHWRIVDTAAPRVRLDPSTTAGRPEVSLEESRQPARAVHRAALDAADVRAVVHDGASWPDRADAEPVFPQLLVTELERRAPENVPASTAYCQLVALTRMLLEGRDDSAVLTRTAEYMEYWRVRERLGYQAADAYADALEDPDELPQRLKRAMQAAETAATSSKTQRTRPRSGDGGRARRPTTSANFRWGRRSSNNSRGRSPDGANSNKAGNTTGYKKPSADRK
ncbi:hypothetical protein DIPPA_14679 [Diplonema papillatum]|nr:hypothetical protein DIPPA_10917 [Diplonema papillatum]KAJ9467388.1 hypothetical protein DIPPA_14679 [Diplonema papillatum]